MFFNLTLHYLVFDLYKGLFLWYGFYKNRRFFNSITLHPFQEDHEDKEALHPGFQIHNGQAGT